MRIRILPILFNRYTRLLGVCTILVFTWGIWNTWPHGPDFQMKLDVGDSAMVMVCPNSQFVVNYPYRTCCVGSFPHDTKYCRLLQLNDGTECYRLNDERGLHISINDDSRTIDTIDMQANINHLDIATGQPLWSVKIEADDPLEDNVRIRWSPNHRWFIVYEPCRPNKHPGLEFRDGRDGSRITRWTDLNTFDWEFLPDSSALLSTLEDGSAIVEQSLDPEKPTRREYRLSPDVQLGGLQLSGDGDTILAKAYDRKRPFELPQRYIIWKRSTGRRFELPVPTDYRRGLSAWYWCRLDRTGRYLACSGEETDRFWDLSCDPPRSLAWLLTDREESVAFDPTGDRILIDRPAQKRIDLFDAADLTLCGQIHDYDYPAELRPCFSPDGKYAIIPDFSRRHLAIQPNIVVRYLLSYLPKLRWFDPSSDQWNGRVVRLADGRITRDIVFDSSTQFANDGAIWTTRGLDRFTQISSSCNIERWAPEIVTPKWLWSVTIAGLAGIAYDFRRAPSWVRRLLLRRGRGPYTERPVPWA